jgi:hypothetical protein
MIPDIAAFRDMAAVLRQRSGLNVNRLAYVKGEWWQQQPSRDKLAVNGTQWVARPDWMFHGWTMRWDGRIRDYRLGYVADRYQPPPRDELGYQDRELWEIWNKKRDPWTLQWSLPLFNGVSGEEVVFSTDTLGGRDALAALLQAFADRADSNPDDGKILPIVELGTSSYQHPDRGKIQIPVLDIIGWAPVPNKPRPPLPKGEPPQALPVAEPQQAIEGQRVSLTSDLNDDSVPF